MINPDFEDDHYKSSPETELESFVLFDAARDVLAKSPKAVTKPGMKNTACLLIEEVFPDETIRPIECTTAVSYSPDKNKTVVLRTTTALVGDISAKAIEIQFYVGAPFGYVYDPGNLQQFSLRPGQEPLIVDPTERNRIAQKNEEIEQSGAAPNSLLALAHSMGQSLLNGDIPEPISGISALWDESTHSYTHFSYDNPLGSYDDDIQPADIQSMMLWLQKASIAIDII